MQNTSDAINSSQEWETLILWEHEILYRRQRLSTFCIVTIESNAKKTGNARRENGPQQVEPTAPQGLPRGRSPPARGTVVFDSQQKDPLQKLSSKNSDHFNENWSILTALLAKK